MFSATLTGNKRLRQQFDALEQMVRGAILKDAAVAGALLIANEAKELAPYDRGNLRRSIHVGGEGGGGGLEGDTTGTDIGGQEIDEKSVEVKVGTNVEYARRLELGFYGADKLGRVYNQPPRPYLRPALQSQKDAAVKEAGAAAVQLMRKAVAS